MRKRVAAKVVRRGGQDGGPDYRDTTIAGAASKLWRAMDPRRRRRWHCAGRRRHHHQERVLSRPAAAA